MYKQKGFTLIELMLVIAIVTLLSSIFMYNTTEAKKKAEDAKMMMEAGQVKTALTLYKEDNGFLPSPYAPGEGGGGGPWAEDTDEYEVSMGKLVPDYLSRVPESSGGGGYTYAVTDDGQSGLFAASLNFGDDDDDDDDDDDNNSCDIVSSKINFGSCELKPNSHTVYTPGAPTYEEYAVVTNYTCDDLKDDPDNQKCFTVSTDFVSNCYCDTNNQYSTSNDYPDEVCITTYTQFKYIIQPLAWDRHFSTRTDVSCSEIVEVGMTILNRNSFICDFAIDESVCGGGVDSDFCECI